MKILLKSLLIFIFILCSGYVMTFGREDTGIKMDYIALVIFIVIILFRM